LVLALTSVVLGAITTLGEALWSANQHPPVGPGSVQFGVTSPSGVTWSSRVWLGSRRDASNFSVVNRGTGPIGLPPMELFKHVPHEPWWRALQGAQARVSPSGFWNSQAYGWPYRSVAAGFYKYKGGQTEWGSFDVVVGGREYYLPYRPIVPGFLANTGIWTGAWMLVLAPVVLLAAWWRRARRRKRGACPGCGYELAGLSGCPECGWNQKGNPAATPQHSSPQSAQQSE